LPFAINLFATLFLERKNPRTVAALGFPARYQFRAYTLACATENDSRLKPLKINAFSRF
jgi:hypothetical protein